MNIPILGLGTATPSGSMAQAEAAELARAYGVLTDEQARLLPVLYRRTRVDRRGSVVLDEPGADLRQTFYPQASGSDDRGPTTRQRLERYAIEALPLALGASRKALAESGVDVKKITQLVTVSCTGFVAPGVDIHLINALGIAPTVGRTNVGFMGCHGAFNGLRTAAVHVRAEPAAHVLMVAVELCSLHYYYGWDPGKVVANALFADGAAAVVLGSGLTPSPFGRGRGEGTPKFSGSTDLASNTTQINWKSPHPNPLPEGEGARPAAGWSLAASGSCIFPDSQDEMTWIIGDHGFEMSLSARVPDLIAANLRPWLEQWLAEQNLRLDQVQSWAIHPGGPRIVGSVLESLGLTSDKAAMSNQVLAECGNMSSPTILFILDRLRKAVAARPCVAIGFGPGLAAEVALFM